MIRESRTAVHGPCTAVVMHNISNAYEVVSDDLNRNVPERDISWCPKRVSVLVCVIFPSLPALQCWEIPGGRIRVPSPLSYSEQKCLFRTPAYRKGRHFALEVDSCFPYAETHFRKQVVCSQSADHQNQKHFLLFLKFIIPNIQSPKRMSSRPQ